MIFVEPKMMGFTKFMIFSNNQCYFINSSITFVLVNPHRNSTQSTRLFIFEFRVNRTQVIDHEYKWKHYNTSGIGIYNHCIVYVTKPFFHILKTKTICYRLVLYMGISFINKIYITKTTRFYF